MAVVASGVFAAHDCRRAMAIVSDTVRGRGRRLCCRIDGVLHTAAVPRVRAR